MSDLEKMKERLRKKAGIDPIADPPKGEPYLTLELKITRSELEKIFKLMEQYGDKDSAPTIKVIPVL